MMAPLRRSIRQSSEQMAQQKGLSKEIATRRLVTRIRAEIHEEQTFSKSEIASATQEPFSPASLPTEAQARGLTKTFCSLFPGEVCGSACRIRETAITLNAEGISDGVHLQSTQWTGSQGPSSMCSSRS